jgi:hypothetical protein
MKRIYTTAQGKNVSIDSIRLENEEVIAVGNMKVNARGDQLGPGGVPIASRQQNINEYYNLHTPTVGATPQARRAPPKAQPLPPSADPLIDEQDNVEIVKPEPALRGSLADSIAKNATITQAVPPVKNAQGPKRI